MGDGKRIAKIFCVSGTTIPETINNVGGHFNGRSKTSVINYRPTNERNNVGGQFIGRRRSVGIKMPTYKR
jgi:hypothetical protein